MKKGLGAFKVILAKVIKHLVFLCKNFKDSNSRNKNTFKNFIIEGNADVKRISEFDAKQLDIRNSRHILIKVHIGSNSKETLKVYQSKGNKIIIRVENHYTPIYLYIYNEEIQVYGKLMARGEMIIYSNKISSDTLYNIKMVSMENTEFLSILEVRQQQL